jgi:glycosyltransferase involved in cell wall biosynthesis
MLVTNEVTRDPRVSRHAETLARMGHDVLVVCPRTEPTSPVEERRLYRIRRCPIFLSLRDIMKRRIRQDVRSYALKERKTSEPHRVSALRRSVAIARGTLVRLIAYPAYLTWVLWRAGREFNAHVYFTNDLDTLLAGVLCSIGSRKLIHDAHELWPDQFIGMGVYASPAIAWIRLLERLLMKHADVVLTVNEFIAEELQRRYAITMPKVILNTPAIDHQFEPSRRSGLRSKKVALYQGLHTFHRGLEELVMACDFLKDDVILVLRGFGPNEERLREIAERFTNCRFERPVDMEELVPVAATTADVGIVPYVPVNINNYFASPNKLFEYIQAGLPVVGSDLPFLRKIILGDKIGYVFDPRDPRSIAQAINAATRDDILPVLRDNVRKIQQQYSWTEEQKKLLEAVNDVASSLREKR